MPKKDWFIHVSGETMGPISTDAVHKMIQQNRVGFLDFIFCEGMYQWSRISEVEEFQDDIPPFPKVPPPMAEAKPAPAAKKKAAPAKPVKAVKPAPVRALRPAPVVEEEVVEEAPVEEEVYEEEVYAEEEVVEEVVAEEEEYVEEEPAPAPAPKRKPAPAPRPAPRAAAPAPQARAVRPAPAAPVRPQPAPRPQPVALPETVAFKTKISVDEFGDYTCDSLGSKYVLVKSGEDLPLGQEVKFVLQSNDLKKPRMMGIVIEQVESESGQSLQKIEFIKVNPMHRRAIEDYIKNSAPQPRVRKAS